MGKGMPPPGLPPPFAPAEYTTKSTLTIDPSAAASLDVATLANTLSAAASSENSTDVVQVFTDHLNSPAHGTHSA